MPVGALIGAGAQIATAGLNNIWASHQSEEDRSRNYYYNEMAAQNADQRQRNLYADFYSPAALARQYTEAGLSPSLMFGGTPGQGGTAGAQGAGASGVKTNFMPMSLVEAAQAASLFANAEKTKTETQEMKGETAKGWAMIQNILADTNNKETAAQVNKAEAAGKALDNYVKENTKEASITMICAHAEQAGYEAETAYEQMRSAHVLAEVNEATLTEQIALKKKELESVAQSITESKSMVRLNDQQRRKLYNDILQQWEQLEINWQELDVSKQQADTYTEWINNQIPIIEKQLGVRLAELEIEKKQMVIDAVTGTIKSLAFGAMAAASFAGGKGSTNTDQVMQSMKKGQKLPKMTKTERKFNYVKQKEIYDI